MISLLFRTRVGPNPIKLNLCPRFVPPVNEFFQYGVPPKQRLQEQQQLKKEAEEKSKSGNEVKAPERYPTKLYPGIVYDVSMFDQIRQSLESRRATTKII
jgi:hypothetical protein